MIEDRYFGEAAAELTEGRFDRNLMARLFVQFKGNEARTKAEFIALRAKALAQAAKEQPPEPMPHQPMKDLDYSEAATAEAVRAMREALALSRPSDQ